MAGAGDRTEKATGRRRQRATDQGQFAYSQELTSTMTLVASLVAAFYFFGSPAGFRVFFSSVLQQSMTGDYTQLIRQAGIYFLTAAAPVFIAAAVAALAGNFMQGMPVFASEKIGLKFDKLNPMQRLNFIK